jgi:hypothetical protein
MSGRILPVPSLTAENLQRHDTTYDDESGASAQFRGRAWSNSTEAIAKLPLPQNRPFDANFFRTSSPTLSGMVSSVRIDPAPLDLKTSVKIIDFLGGASFAITSVYFCLRRLRNW